MTTAVPVIGVCGPIGAGKSTAVRGLASALGFHPWLERVDDNPFFARYSRDRGAWALRSQLAFVLGAVEDAVAARQRPPGGVLERPAQEMHGVFVRDLHDGGLLDADELGLLDRVVVLGEKLAGVPDLLIVLSGDPAHLHDRIRARADPGDDSYELEDMQRLSAVYDDWRARWDRSPVIDVDTVAVDLRRPSEIDRIAAAARSELGLRALT